MRRMILAFALFMGATGAHADVLRGTVVNATTGETLSGVRLEILESHVSDMSDEAGAFSLQVPASWPATLVASHPSFRVFRKRLDATPSGELRISLEPTVSFTDRIEVTAGRAREGEDPATFTNIPRETVEQAYWGQDPAMLLASVAPGYYAYNDNGNGIGYSYFTIRGFGQARSRVTLNGAPLNDAESGELFFIDLNDFLATTGDIQVRRGVFGLSGIGGAVDVTTATPAVEPSFSFHAGAGSYGTRRLTARFESGLINGEWALSARYSKTSTDGYRDQSWVDMWNVFLSLQRFGERSSLQINLFGGPEDTHLAYLGVPRTTLDGALTGDSERDRRFNPLDYPGEIDHFFQPHVQLVHSLAIGPTLQLDQTLYLFQGDGYYDQYKSDRSFFEYNLPDVVLPDGSVITSSDLVRRRKVDETDSGWVPRLIWTSGPWSWSVGGEVRLHRAHHTGEVTWAQYYPVDIPPDKRYYDYRVGKETFTLAVGGSYRASEILTISAGLQGTRHRYRMSDDRIKGVAFSESYDFLLPRLGALLRLTDGVDAYANLARGMREPSFRTIYDPQDYWASRVSLDPEDVWDWEAGVSLRKRRWRLRANVFSMRFANEIVWAGALDDSGVPVYGNGARSHHRGLELDATLRPSSLLSLDAAVTLSRNTFTRYSEHGWDGGTEIYDGNRIPGYPDILASATARASLGALEVAVTGRWVGSFYLDSSQDNRRHPERRREEGYVPLENPAFTTADVALTTPAPRRVSQFLGARELSLQLRVNNALGETYTSFGYVDGGEPQFIPAAGRTFYAGLTLAF